MSHEEQIILQFLRENPETFFSRKEISRRAVKRVVYENNPRWADIPLAALVGRGLVEVNDQGCYRFKKDAVI